MSLSRRSKKDQLRFKVALSDQVDREPNEAAACNDEHDSNDEGGEAQTSLGADGTGNVAMEGNSEGELAQEEDEEEVSDVDDDEDVERAVAEGEEEEEEMEEEHVVEDGNDQEEQESEIENVLSISEEEQEEENVDILRQMDDHSWSLSKELSWSVSEKASLVTALKSRRKKQLVDTEGDQEVEADRAEEDIGSDVSHESSAEEDAGSGVDGIEEGAEDDERSDSSSRGVKRARKGSMRDFIAEDKVKKVDLNALTHWRLKRDEMKKQLQEKKAQARPGHSQEKFMEDYRKRAAITLKRLDEERVMEEIHRLQESQKKVAASSRLAAEPRKIFLRRADEEHIRYVGCAPPNHRPPPCIKAPQCAMTGKPAKYRTREGVFFADLRAFQALRRKDRIGGQRSHMLLKPPRSVEELPQKVEQDRSLLISQKRCGKGKDAEQKVGKEPAKKTKVLKRVSRYGPQVCVVTGAHPAKYCHPKSGLPYATKEAFARLDVVFQSGGMRACTHEFDLIELNTPLGSQFVPRDSLHLVKQFSQRKT